MDWNKIFTIVGINIGLAGLTIGFVIWAVNKLHTDIDSLGNRLDIHSRRIDQLYQICIDMLKQGKP